MIGLSVRTFLLHSVNFCLHGCYFALGLSQLVCSIQRILLYGQLFGEDIFLLFQGLKLEAHDCELILVGPRRICNFGSSVGWLVALWWGLCGKVFLGGSGIILGVVQGGLWFSSLFGPSNVGFRAGNTVGALVGSLASL